MPGHFTHIYTARRVADLLSAKHGFDDWPDLGVGGDAVRHFDAAFCGKAMRDWPKFTAVGAIGPDLFFFSEDWSKKEVGPQSDRIMLALAAYYSFDAAKEQDWEPLLIILDQVDSTMAGIIRFLIKMDKAWKDFVKVWDETVGPVVNAVGELTDDLLGGALSEAKVALEELLVALKLIGEQEVTTFAHVWDRMNTVVARGYPEENFLWSDMTHYRRTSATCQALVRQAELHYDAAFEDGGERFQQFLAFALGYIVHVGTDTIAHSFVNEQCGGPYRNHPTRHHLIENHIDAWNYRQSAEGGTIPRDAWGANADYPDLSMSALWFAVQLTPDEPNGKERPALTGDPDKDKAALDVDGELPDWLANGIVAALVDTFQDHPHPTIYQGSRFQERIDNSLLTAVVRDVTGHGLPGPFQQVLDGIAPPPPFEVPVGFPLPWEVATAYRLMITLYKLNFNGTWEMEKPRKPDFVIVPPASDFTDLAQPPDFSGVDLTNPVEDTCAVFIALVEWVVKEIGDAIQLLGDLIKEVMSPLSYWFRLKLYHLALRIWDVSVKTHDVLAHTGFSLPHGESRYDDGELRLPNEIDLPLITLGGTVDATFLAALADAVDPFGVLDRDSSFIAGHEVNDRGLPYYPVLRYHDAPQAGSPEEYAYHRPWAYPSISERSSDGVHWNREQTASETYDPSACTPPKLDAAGQPVKRSHPARPGPYLKGTRPDEVFFRTDAGHDAEHREQDEHAQTPWATDDLNDALLLESQGRSPLGDPVPFSAYLIGRLVNDTGYSTQFNLDADRAYAYLTWDWIRDKAPGTTELGVAYALPAEAPWAAPDDAWKRGARPMKLHYVDAPGPVPVDLTAPRPEPASSAPDGGPS